MCAMVCLVLLFTPGASALEQIRFGSVAMEIPAVMHERLMPLAEYLEGELKTQVSLYLSHDMPAAVKAVAENRVQVSYLTPLAYIRAKEAGNVRLVVKTVTRGRSSFRLVIVVKQLSPIKKIADLAGKSFAFGDSTALLQRAVVEGAGIEIERFAEFHFLDHHDNVARGVLNGDFDAGIIKESLISRQHENALRVLYRSPKLPPYVIVVSRNVPDKTYRAIRAAFLKLSDDYPGHLRIIKTLDKNYTGFATVDDGEYDVVRRLIAPFNK